MLQNQIVHSLVPLCPFAEERGNFVQILFEPARPGVHFQETVPEGVHFVAVVHLKFQHQRLRGELPLPSIQFEDRVDAKDVFGASRFGRLQRFSFLQP